MARGAAPSFIQKPAIKQLDGGKKIVFECKIAADPLPQLTWFRDNIQLSEGGRYTYISKEESPGKYYFALELSEPQAIDAATYRLNAKNQHGESNANLKLNFDVSNAPAGQAPSFTAKPAIRQAGKGVVFEVRLQANPGPTIQWYHGTEKVNDGGRFKVVTQTDGLNYTLMLEISDVTTADGGAYKVNAKNSLGESNANINLNLEAPPKGQGKAPKFLAKPAIEQVGGGKIRMSVLVEAAPEPTVTWFRETTVVEKSERISIRTEGGKQEDSYLLICEITDATSDDAGKYKCTAKNDSGTSNANLTLNIETPPKKKDVKVVKPVVKLEPKFEIVKNKIVIIIIVQSVAKPTYNWSFGSTKISKTSSRYSMSCTQQSEGTYQLAMEVTEIKQSDSGEYKCTIKNEAGEIVKVVPVTVDGVEEKKDEKKDDKKAAAKKKEEEAKKAADKKKEEEAKKTSDPKQNAAPVTNNEDNKPKGDAPQFNGTIEDTAINLNAKGEWKVEVKGATPITVSWYRDGKKIKSSRSIKITFVRGIAKLTFLEAQEEEAGEYRVEAVNSHGQNSLTANLEVTVPKKMALKKPKQKDKAGDGEGEQVNLKAIPGKKKPPPKKEEIKADDTNKENEGRLFPKRKRPELEKMPEKKPPPEKEPKAKEVPEIVVPEETKKVESKPPPKKAEEKEEPANELPPPSAMGRRRSSVRPPSEDEEESQYFQRKPGNKVVTEGDTMSVDLQLKEKPQGTNLVWYRVKNKITAGDPRVTMTFDESTLIATLEVKKCKMTDEAKYKCQLEDDSNTVLDFAGFSVFVKDPKDSGLDFRSLLRHKDMKGKKKKGEGPDWGDLKSQPKEKEEYDRRRRPSDINLMKGGLKSREKDEGPKDHWIDELQDQQCKEKDAEVTLTCKYSKPNAKLRWLKNKLEIFHGHKYNFMTTDEGEFKLTIRRIGMEDAGRYTCTADDKSTSAELVVEEKKVLYYFTQKLPKVSIVKQKQDISLECMLSDPRPHVKWLRNGEPIEYTPGKYEISRRENRCILKVKNARPDDADEYSCEVEGDTTATTLKVEDPDYEFVKPLQDTDAYEKDTAKFVCELNDEDAKVTWYKEDKEIDVNDAKYFTVVEGKKRILEVRMVKGTDEGRYSCKVQDKTTTAKLYVAPDVIISKQLEAQKKMEREDAAFSCKVKNPNKYPITWLKNGEELKVGEGTRYEYIADLTGVHTLNIKSLKLSDEGVYTCKIGDRHTEAKLLVDEAERPPKVDFDKVPREITIKAGKDLELEIPYEGTIKPRYCPLRSPEEQPQGSPLPKATWTKDGKPIPSAEVNQTPDFARMKLKAVKRPDQGEYQLELSNDSGKEKVPITIKVIDRPSPPEGPLEVSDVYKDRCRLSWKPSKDDGGLPIEHYLVEAMDTKTGTWTEVGKVQGDTQCGVPGLTPGRKYKFRVKAVNQEGASDPLTTKTDTLAKDPWDPPSKPGKPVIEDYDKDRVQLSWTAPKKDGGAPIKKYIIEKKPKFGEWSKVGSVPGDETVAEVPGLDEGKDYEFRVIPVNEAGPGDPSDESPVVRTKARRGERIALAILDFICGINFRIIRVTETETRCVNL